MTDISFFEDALTKFVGCDSDVLAAGTPGAPSIWLFGIEHGTYRSRHNGTDDASPNDNYSVETQRRWPYNQKAFKLLAAMEGRPVAEWYEFAKERRPFEKGSKGFFKGNLYPFACNNVAHWPEDAARETGIADKADYVAWCRTRRLPAIRAWVMEHQPRIFIGVGIGNRADFAEAVFDVPVTLTEGAITAGAKTRRVFHHATPSRSLVIIPHFSGPNGLNSNALLQATGEFIASLMTSPVGGS